jgi:hypothetical protein
MEQERHWLKELGKHFRNRLEGRDDFGHSPGGKVEGDRGEPLPRRWVELIHHLEAEEQARGRALMNSLKDTDDR